MCTLLAIGHGSRMVQSRYSSDQGWQFSIDHGIRWRDGEPEALTRAGVLYLDSSDNLRSTSSDGIISGAVVWADWSEK
jgi:hypothetical protein